MHEILEDDENVGAPGSWASPRLDENHHTSARRFRLPIKGVFPFDAPPRRYLLFLFFFFFRYVILAVVSLSVDDIHRVVVVFYVSVKGERRWFVSRVCTALFLSIRVFLSIHFSSWIILLLLLFFFVRRFRDTKHGLRGILYTPGGRIREHGQTKQTRRRFRAITHVTNSAHRWECKRATAAPDAAYAPADCFLTRPPSSTVAPPASHCPITGRAPNFGASRHATRRRAAPLVDHRSFFYAFPRDATLFATLRQTLSDIEIGAAYTTMGSYMNERPYETGNSETG